VLVAGLQGVDNAEDLGGVATSGGWVREDGADGLLWVDDEDGTNGERDSLGVNVGCVLVVQHVVGEGDLALLVANDGELKLAAGNLVDIRNPAAFSMLVSSIVR